ncbi:MAG: LemA family protein [Inquilinaceae bacterium]
MTGLSIVLLVVLGLIVLVVGWGIVTYNGFVARRQRTREGWSGIDVQLKRRTNLIPNLIETVKGYVKHERDALEAVTEMRARCQSAATADAGARQEAEGGLSTALMRLFAVAENYPDLKADGTFLELQRTLAELEDQIQMARRYYNGTVRDLNTMVESFPSNIVAKLFSFQPAAYYEVDHASERLLPKVAF